MEREIGNLLTSRKMTPEMARDRPEQLRQVTRDWLKNIEVMGDEENCPEGHSRTVVVIVGKKHPKLFVLTAQQVALLIEATRYEHSIATNSNFAKNPRVYLKFIFAGADKDAMPVSRLFAAAGPHEAVSVEGIESDLRPEYLAKFGAGKAQKDAIATFVRHVERLAAERERSGRMPDGLTKEEYLENFHALLKAVNEEREAACG